MNYAGLRAVARTGDKITVSSPGLVGNLIRSMMGDSESHVAVLEWDHAHQELFVHEMRELRGYNLSFASTWCRQLWKANRQLTFVRAPDAVVADPERAREWLRDQRRIEARYGYATLLLVFGIRRFGWSKVSGWFGRRIDYERVDAVCSVFAQRFDEAMGYTAHRAPLVAPQAFLRYRGGQGNFPLYADDTTTGAPERQVMHEVIGTPLPPLPAADEDDDTRRAA